MKRFYFICIFLLGYFSSRSQELINADSMFFQEKFLNAAIAYERMAFESGNQAEKNVFLLKKSYCYKAMGNYGVGRNILERVVIYPSDSLYDIVVYEKVLLSYLNDDYQTSYNEVLKHSIVRGPLTPELIYLQSLNLIAMSQWKEAKQLLVKNAEQLGLDTFEIDDAFPKKLKPKNPDKAFNLSMFFPGVGQMYAGYFFKGLVSGGIQATLIAFSAYSLYKGYFLTGGLTGVALWYTFYFGGARYSRELAEQKNRQTCTEISRELDKYFRN